MRGFGRSGSGPNHFEVFNDVHPRRTTLQLTSNEATECLEYSSVSLTRESSLLNFCFNPAEKVECKDGRDKNLETHTSKGYISAQDVTFAQVCQLPSRHKCLMAYPGK